MAQLPTLAGPGATLTSPLAPLPLRQELASPLAPIAETTVIFTETGTWQPPAGLIVVDLIEAWGSGGGGGNSFLGDTGAGGGGGSYAAMVDFVVDDQVIYDVVAAPTNPAETAGTNSYFLDTGTMRARGGNAGIGNVEGAGGTGTGDITFKGGNGAGGGGGGAGTTEDGYDSISTNGGVGGADGGGTGGARGAPDQPGADGADRGGGGGGSGANGPNGGGGGRGEVRITYTPPSGSPSSVSVTGAGTAAANGIYTYRGIHEDGGVPGLFRPYYTLLGQPTPPDPNADDATIAIQSAFWSIGTATGFYNGAAGAFDSPIFPWEDTYVVNNGDGPAPTLTEV